MNSAQFLAVLQRELQHISRPELNQILADYEAYFHEAVQSGSSEAEVVRALGSPLQLARELTAEVRIKEWEERRSLACFMRLFAAAVALGLANVLLFIPLAIIGIVFLSLFMAGAALLLSGLGLVLASVPGLGLSTYITLDIAGRDISNQAVMALAGIGIMCMGFVWFWCDMWLAQQVARWLVGFARLNYRVVRGGI